MPFNVLSFTSFLGLSIMVKAQGSSVELMYKMADSGSTAAPPHSPPPSKPGKIQTPSFPGGVNILPYFTWLNFSISFLCASGDQSATSDESNFILAKGSGKEGIGCVGQGSSPG